MNDHDDVRERIALRRYGELDEREELALDEHLAGCAPCRAFAAELAERLAPLDALRGEAPPPPGWFDGVLARARGAEAARRRAAGLAFAGGLAAGILATLGLLGGVRSRAEPPRAPAGTRTVTAPVASPLEVAFLDAPPPPAAPGSSFGLRSLLGR